MENTKIFEYFGNKFLQPSIRPLASELLKRLFEGSVCIDLDELPDEEAKRLSRQAFLEAIPQLIDGKILAEDPGASVPFIMHGSRIYLQRYFRYEKEIVDKIRVLVGSEASSRKERQAALGGIKDFIIGNFREPDKNTGHGPDFQLVAALQAFLNNFTVITGGPGVGKTTTIKKLLSIVLKINIDTKVLLCAPTGKAAQRMKESLTHNIFKKLDQGILDRINVIADKASTIHRLLGSRKGGVMSSPHFKHDKDNPLDCDLLIVDESSMIDVALFAKLLAAVPDTARVVFLGDKDQLASVEAASIFGDICQSAPLNAFSPEDREFLHSFLEGVQQVPQQEANADGILSGHIIELKFSHRFLPDKGIGKLSRAVVSGNWQTVQEIVDAPAQQGGQVTVDTAYDEGIFNDFIEKYREYIDILREGAFSEEQILRAFTSLNRYRVLVAVREGEHGLYKINRKIEQRLSRILNGEPPVRIFYPSGAEFYEFRPVMVTQNNYAVSPTLYNGDVGIIAKDTEGHLKAWFEKDGGIEAYPPGQLGIVETNFAQTIHKSQGSEYDEVFVLLPQSTQTRILTRELLYTGVTRAKSHVTLSGPAEVIEAAVNRQVQRMSGIRHQLQAV
jgi:exodeoxyribonuclease V alpha subunit